ncbi:AI-2E family transporter [Butyricicoccus sp. AM29-23AC]|nr:AI-2E family transporter [Butyricicoccus sp. AM29-23AC]
MGRGNLCPVGFGGCSLGTCLCAVSACKEGSRRGTFEKTHCDSPSAKEGTAASEYCLSDQPNLANFVSGQLTEAVIIGVLCFFGMLILGIPYAGAVSAFVAVTALVPIFGAWIGGGLGAFLILLAEPGKALWFILFLLILQQVEGNLIYPKVVGKSVGLPGLLVLMAVTIGGEAFGVLGMLFSVPVCAVLYSLYLEFMKKASTNH